VNLRERIHIEKRKLRYEIWLLWDRIQSFPTRARCYIWNRGILLFWYKLWIRTDEDHKSFRIDTDAMSAMTREKAYSYYADLLIRRWRQYIAAC